MGDFVDIVASILTGAQRRVEVSAQNISNIATPGYKRLIAFQALVEPDSAHQTAPGAARPSNIQSNPATDFSPGKQMNTGNANDLAILGDGFFAVRDTGGALLYTRQGNFSRDAGGRLVTPQGYALQVQGGGDLVLKPGDFQVQSDGTVVQAGEAVAHVDLVDFTDPMAATLTEGSLYTAPESAVVQVDAPSLSQGALEASNVSTGAEMVTIMAALRSAQAGQHLMNVYDDLMGRAISSFGQG